VTDFNRYVWSFYRWGLDLLFPPSCVSCKRVGAWLCEPCAQQIPLFEGTLCPRCGRPWSKPDLCPVCRKTPLQVNPIRSVFIFDSPIREALHALKYRGGGSVVTTLAARMDEAWRRQGMESDLLLPVPLHPSREVKRGYNQATLLALALGKQVDVPVGATLLRKPS
jgi:predicted amidophosphoribosyltransferase